MGAIVFQSIETHIRIPIKPIHLSDIAASVYSFLNLFLGRYIKMLRGIVICYNGDISVLQEAGTIDNLGEVVYYKVAVEFVIMRIIINQPCTGLVEGTTTDDNQVELLVHGILPVKVPADGRTRHGWQTFVITKINIGQIVAQGIFID
ncbi:hypothetical protein NEHOM01_1300 [Nematocida homosporus]|uniref:uncharacterized protein n=1 Tax=Nematocida homosporus TaxID=1912981 RepID=UPI0022201AF6|nr:uncharacterized protein NEHOM01_1300 [Nematocida homosporus]KAI5186135.1 hypothetical protein NEHOM01_1300 [Nematocida homosporus]